VKLIKSVVVLGVIGLVVNFGWHFFTDPPSTLSVCYTWSKATDPLADTNGVDGADWLATNLKTEKDLRAINKEVLSAMRLYDTGVVVADSDPYGRHGLRQFVLDACEKASPGSTKH